MLRFLPVSAAAILMAAPAFSQSSPLNFTIDQAASQFTFGGSTPLGPVVGNPNTFNLSGDANLRLSAGATQPVETLRFSPGGSALVSPDLSAVIPNPVPFLPPLATIDITGLTLQVTSLASPVSAAGTFSAVSRATTLAGIITVAPLGGTPTVTDLAGSLSDPVDIDGSVTVTGDLTEVSAPLALTFAFTDPGSGLTATINLTGLIELDYLPQQPVNYCMNTTNSSGAAAVISSTGTVQLSAQDLGLAVTALPNNSLGFFLFSADQAFVPGFGGSQGNLCLGGQILRLSNFIQSSGTTGQVALALPFNGLPTGANFDIGGAWNFQYWFRDSIGGMATSNTSDGLAVVFAP